MIMEEQKKEPMNEELLSLLNSRLSLAQAFGKDYRKEVETGITEHELKSFEKLYFPDLHNRLQVPYIFSTNESALPAMFEQFPEIYMYQGGKKDADFTEFTNNIWSHLEKKCGIKAVTEEVAFTFNLSGLSGARWGWETETEVVPEEVQQPVMDELGQPVMDESGQPVSQTITKEREVIVKDQPYLSYMEYDRVHFSPESKFCVIDKDNKDIPYFIYEEILDKDIAEYIYETTIDGAEEIDLSKVSSNLSNNDSTINSLNLNKGDLSRVHVYHYYGRLPKKSVGDDWKPYQPYYSCFTKEQILKQPETISNKRMALMGNYGAPSRFFKFGDSRALRELERDISFGRSSMMDYRDKLATKVAVPHGAEFDEASFKSPKEFTLVRFIGDKYPQYITPAPVPDVIPTLINQSREDIQMTSGQLDVSRGGTTNTVNTATGQKIFQGVHEKRVNRKREKIGEFLIAVAENLLVLCANNWDVEEFAKITDLDPQEIIENGYIDKLKQIGTVYDIYIDIESVVNNKEAKSAQAIAMYRELKDSQIVNQDELIKSVIKIGFDQRDVDRYLNNQLPPEKLMQAIQQLMEMQFIPEPIAMQLIQAIQDPSQFQGQQAGGDVGRPPTQDPTAIVQKSMPGSDSTQISAQNAAAYKQIGVPKQQR